jgi:predicted DNA-binding transcriptional regulator AlpA
LENNTDLVKVSLNFLDMKPFTFDQIPVMMNKLSRRIDDLERLIKALKLPEQYPEELMDIKQASVLLRLAIPTIYSKVSRNEIPVSKQGKKLYFCKSELIDWIKRGRNRTNAEILHSVDSHKKDN